MSFKQRIFNWIAKLEDKKAKLEEQKRDLSQPIPNKDGKESKGDKAKRIFKKLIPLFIIIAILALIIGLAVGLTNRPTSYSLPGPIKNDGTGLVVVGKKVTINTENPAKTVTINNYETDLLKVYYVGSTSQAEMYFDTGSGLPLKIRASYNDTNNDAYFGNIQIASSYAAGTPLGDFRIFIQTQIRNVGVVPSAGFNWGLLVSSLLPIVTLLILLFFYSKMMKKATGGLDIFNMGKTGVKNNKPNVKFTDVAGIAEVKAELNEVVDFIRRPEKYAAMGARCPKGVILYGPPGTGKTLIAKAVAGESNCNFYPISGSAFEDMLVGVGAKRVKDLFATARKSAPSIIFIDEIDSVASKRGKNEIMGGGSGIADQTINQLLAEMDGFDSSAGIVVIGATNRLDVLDDAILRPGRFDRHIQVNLPDISEREEILKIHSKNKNISPKVSLLEIARRTPGFSGAQLENVLNEATLLAVRENQISVTMENLDEAIDRTIGGPQRAIRVMTEEEKRQICYHEAGHALVGLYADSPEVVQKITIIPRGNAAGYTLQTPKDQEKQIQTKENLLDMIRMTLGGRASEEVIFGKDKISTGAANDLYKITRLAKSMVTQLGMSKLGLMQYIPSEGQQPMMKEFSEQTSREIDQAINEIIDNEYTRAKEIINGHKDELELMVETLMVLETIYKHQIDYIHEHKKLPEEAIKAKEEQDKAKSDSESDNSESSSETSSDSEN